MIGATTSGFSNPGIGSQQVFRTAMNALAFPARALPLHCPPDVRPPPGLSVEVACLLLTLTDFETIVWFQPLAGDAGNFLRFHTGARSTDDMHRADFAVIADAAALPPLHSFMHGTDPYPDRSATLIVQAGMFADLGWTCRGPGIENARTFCASPLPADFLAQWTANTAQFPRGVDILLVAGNRIAGLPRTTRLTEA